MPGERTVDLLPLLRDELATHKAGSRFTNLERAGRQPLPLGLTPHDLRRTFVSLLFALGEDLPYVMDQVGHADSRMTTGIYMKAMRRDPGQKAALRALVERGVLAPNWPHGRFRCPGAAPS